MINSLHNEVLIYTRKPNNDYTASLANSIHFAYKDEKGEFVSLNRNYGILFAEATVNEQNVIVEKGIKNPYLFHTATGSFGIIAVRVAADGKEDEESKGQIICWTSEDLIRFKFENMIRVSSDVYVDKVKCIYDEVSKTYLIDWLGMDGKSYQNILNHLSDLSSISSAINTSSFNYTFAQTNLEDIHPGNILLIDENLGKSFCSFWTPIYNTDIVVPDHITLNDRLQLEEIKATAIYSDGSKAEKDIVWDFKDIDFTVAGNYIVEGEVVQEKYPFPLAIGYADPVILPWNQKYYYIATNDNMDDVGIYVREADSISELFSPNFTESLILDKDEERGFIQTFWAPEFHQIGEELYILFAIGGKVWGPQCHLMKLKKGGSIMNPSDWEAPVRIKKADGKYLTDNGITLDMTYFKADGVSCVVWSYRYGIGTTFDTGSMLYIATVDEANPSVLTSEPVLLSRPLFGWENIQGTINNEGPYPIITDNTVYITYSGGAACGYTYALGLLTIPRGSNFLDVSAWTKSHTPVLSYYSSDGIYGPGHNSFFKNYDGNVFIMYHGERELVPFGIRCSAMHRVHFDSIGVPHFDVTGDRDLDSNKSHVKIGISIEV